MKPKNEQIHNLQRRLDERADASTKAWWERYLPMISREALRSAVKTLDEETGRRLLEQQASGSA